MRDTFGKRTQTANPILTSEAIKWSVVILNDGEIPNTENNMPFFNQ